MIPISTLAKAALLLGLVLGLTAGFFFFVRKWAGRNGQSVQDASKMLTKFRELHAHGGLSDDEYRTIKTKLASELEIDLATFGEQDEARESASDKSDDGKSRGDPAFES